MDKKVFDILNTQINKEMYSAYLYLDMANFYSQNALDGFAHWYEVQANEEMEHAMKIYHYLLANGQKVTLEAIAKPDKTYKEFIEPVEAAYEHEQYVTSLIMDCFKTAREVDDIRTMRFLGWFIDEQGEEEENASSILDKIKLFGDDKKALYSLDKELGQRQ